VALEFPADKEFPTAVALCGPETALILLGIPKLVRFDKIRPDGFEWYFYTVSSEFEVRIISRGVQGWVELAIPIRSAVPATARSGHRRITNPM
jgi:hypothetical protein